MKKVIRIATVAIWKVCSNLKHVINYISDSDKTDLSNFVDLENSLEYIKDEFKTEKKLFIDGINCNPKNALNEMIDIKKKFMKTDGVLGWHAYQSFKEGEVSPEEAHKIGIELANEMWGDKFQVVVSTHLNTSHFHNHFLINSVSFVDGKKYNADRTSYAELRKLSNEICMEHGLSYLVEKKTKSGINYYNYQNKNLKYSNYYRTAKEDLDYAISISHSYDEFKQILINMGYEINIRANKLSIRNQNYKRNIRIERYYGNDYSIENIKKQIMGLYLPERKNYYNNLYINNDLIKTLFKPKYKSFKSMYIRYCNILQIYPYLVKRNFVSSELKSDIKKLDMYSEQAKLLVKNKLETEASFITFMKSKEEELCKLKSLREDKWKELKKIKSENKDEVNKIIIPLNEKIKTIGNELKICKGIMDRKEIIKSNIEKLNDKEMIINEYIK